MSPCCCCTTGAIDIRVTKDIRDSSDFLAELVTHDTFSPILAASWSRDAKTCGIPSWTLNKDCLMNTEWITSLAQLVPIICMGKWRGRSGKLENLLK